MHKNILTVVGITILFLGLAIQPSIATVQPEQEIDIEPKDYLFQTIIDIANNPEVKNLLEKYKPDLFKVDIDKSVYRKLFLRNPRLMFNTLLTKPSLSIEYLDKCYNEGVEITNILGADKVLEIIGIIEQSDKEFLNELNNIILKDEKLSNRIETLKEMNTKFNPTTPFRDNPIICSILLVIFLGFVFIFGLEIIFELIFFPILLVVSKIFPEIYDTYNKIVETLIWCMVISGFLFSGYGPCTIY